VQAQTPATPAGVQLQARERVHEREIGPSRINARDDLLGIGINYEQHG
jgi:hypothetical protein